jgi:hypothetical protein
MSPPTQTCAIRGQRSASPVSHPNTPQQNAPKITTMAQLQGRSSTPIADMQHHRHNRVQASIVSHTAKCRHNPDPVGASSGATVQQGARAVSHITGMSLQVCRPSDHIATGHIATASTYENQRAKIPMCTRAWLKMLPAYTGTRSTQTPASHCIPLGHAFAQVDAQPHTCTTAPACTEGYMLSPESINPHK